MKRITWVAALLAGVGAVPLMARQDPPAPVVLGAAKPMSPAEVAVRLNGTWKLNEDLSPLPRAGSSPTAGAPDRSGRGGANGAGRGGRGAVPGAMTQIQQQELRIRAIYRELTVRPFTLKITATAMSAKFVDEDDVERLLNINNKKDKLDLGTSIVDSKAYWDGSALTLELDGGPQAKLYEIFELSPTGRQMLVTLKTDGADDPKPGQLRGYIQRVYDRVG